MNNKLHKALRIQKQKTQQVEQEIYGSLGIPLGGRKLTDVPDRPSFVYVRLRDNQNEVVQAFNNKVTSSYNLPVILHREGTRYVIDGVNTQRYQSNWNNSAAYLPRHGVNHSFYDGGGGDVTWVYSRQIMPYLIYPDSTITGSYLKMSPHTYLDTNNQWKIVGGTGTPSLLQYLPTGGNDAIMGLLYLDAPTGNPKLIINSGTPFSNLLTGTGDIYPYIPVPNIYSQIPLAAIRLSSGTNNINWDNIYDVRQWLRVASSGTASGGGGGGGIDTLGFAGLADGIPIGTGTFLNIHGAAFTRSGTTFDLNITGSASGGIGISGSFIQDEGVPQGFVTTFNFVGVNIDASVSGSVARIFVTGSTGGGSNPPVTGSFVVQNNGTTLGSATILNFTNGVTASISGSVAQIQVTGTATYVRTAPPISLSSVTGAYWRTQESIFVSGSLALFNQGHALIPAIDYLEQYPASGTFQYISTPPTGTYNLAIYGVPVAGGNISGGGGSSNTLPAGMNSDDIHPASPDAYSDEFDADTGPSGTATWAWRNQNSSTYSIANDRLYFTYPAQASQNFHIFEKDIPAASTWIIQAKLSLVSSAYAAYHSMGLMLWDSVNSKGLGFTLFNHSGRNAISYSITLAHVNSSFADVSETFLNATTSTPFVFQIEKTSTKYLFSIGQNASCLSYISAFDETIGSYCTPTKIGFCGDTQNTTYDLKVIWEWIRKTA